MDNEVIQRSKPAANEQPAFTALQQYIDDDPIAGYTELPGFTCNKRHLYSMPL